MKLTKAIENCDLIIKGEGGNMSEYKTGSVDGFILSYSHF